MARSLMGAAITERYYRRTRLLSLALAILLRALWEAMNLASGRAVPSAVVSRWLREVDQLLTEYRQLSLAMAHDYFVTYVSTEHPEVALRPAGGNVSEWATKDVELNDDIDTLAKVMLSGRIGQIPDAAQEVVRVNAGSTDFDVSDPDFIAKVMGDDWAEYESDAPGSLTVVPDTNPVGGENTRNRMLHKGPKQYESQALKIEELTRASGADTGDSLEETKRIRKAKKSDAAYVSSTNAAVRMVDAGQDLVRAAAAAHGMGYVRVLGPQPCSFCVMLAAQGIVYEQGAWDEADARFRTWTSEAGNAMQGGSAKVHDGCQCRLQPVPLVGDVQMPEGVRRAQKLWEEATGRFDDMSWMDKVSLFRKVYHRGDIDREYIEELERDRLATERDMLRLTIPNLMMHLAHYDALEEETGEDRSHHKDFYRGQLEYRLRKWEERGYGDTDWQKEYRWVIERASAIWDPEDVTENLEQYDALIAAEENSELRQSFSDNRHFLVWVTEQAPDAWRNRADYWDTYSGGDAERADRLVDPKMPEF